MTNKASSPVSELADALNEWAKPDTGSRDAGVQLVCSQAADRLTALEAENARLRDMVKEQDKALESLIEAADSASWAANIGTMDNAIEAARRVREGGKVDG